jgi:hypothetical protein
MRLVKATDWEHGGNHPPSPFSTSLEATPAGFSNLQKLGDKVPFIEIDLRKSLKGLLPGQGPSCPNLNARASASAVAGFVRLAEETIVRNY